MGATIIVGGQSGNEGKTKVLDFWNVKENFDVVIQTNGSVSSSNIPMQVFPRLVSIWVENIDKFLEEMKESPVETFKIDQFTLITSQEGWRKRAKDIPELEPYVDDVQNLLCELTVQGASIVIEGQYGYMDSYQYLKDFQTTHMDTTASSVVSRCGIGIFDVDEIIMVYQLTDEFDLSLARQGISVTDPNVVIINGFDQSESDSLELDDSQLERLQSIENDLNISIDYVGTGPNTLLSVDEIKAENGFVRDETPQELEDDMDVFVEEFKAQIAD